MNLDKYFVSIPREVYVSKQSEFVFSDMKFFSPLQDIKKIVDYLINECYPKWEILEASIPIEPALSGTYKAIEIVCKKMQDVKISNTSLSAIEICLGKSWTLLAFCTEDDDWFWVSLDRVPYGTFQYYFKCDGVVGFLKLIEQITLKKIPKKEDLLR